MKILLVNPTGHKIGMDHFLKAPPLGLMILAATVPDHDVEILDLRNYKYSPGYFEKKVQKFDLLGVSASTSMINDALKLCKIAKDHDVKTIIGGYHASLVPETAMYPQVDLTVRGEGEITFPEVINTLENSNDLKQDLKEIKGINFKNDSKLYQTENRPLINLNDSPFPRRDLVEKYHYHYFWATIETLESSRGCPHQCHFCCISHHWGRGWRSKSPERIIEEFHHMDRKKNWFVFNDSESTLNMKRIEKICDLTMEYGYHRKWKSCQGRVDDIVKNPHIIDKMADAGWRMMFIGIESIHQKSLDTIGKRISINQIRKAVKMLHDRGITIFGSIIIGNIGETKADVMKTIHFAEDLSIDIMQFTPLTPYPKTDLYKQAKQNGWIIDEDFTNWNLVNPIMRTPDLSTEEIFELVKYAYRNFYFRLREKMHKSFFIRSGIRFLLNPRFWWFWKMARKFIVGGIKVAPDFMADLKSKEYLEIERQREEKKRLKQLKKLEKKKKKEEKVKKNSKKRSLSLNKKIEPLLVTKIRKSD
ncbi:MAG: radical SAM protein [Candidatus Helarchaeota archaeon]|nr:radical SAM protein [Candidatus Helarchaeota archaeon]